MNSRHAAAFVFFAVLAVPFCFHSKLTDPPRDALSLVIVSPHNEAIRYEFGKAFDKWHRERFGRPVVIDWRNIGGTTEISRYLASQYTAAFRAEWAASGHKWTAETASSFNNPKIKPEDSTTPEGVREARSAFLASRVGVGIDLFFGGGEYDHTKQAGMGQIVPSGYKETDEGRSVLGAQIPEFLSGEKWYDKEDLWYGTTVSAFGICYNLDSIRRFEGAMEPVAWRDLGQPALLGSIALADPTKSGSSAKAFEMVLQQEMALAVAGLPASGTRYEQGLARGWEEGLDVIRRASANARYFSDTASKVPLDVANGDASAGMCIDFYGLYQAALVAGPDGTSRMRYVSPKGGTTVGCDPISMLRGAPHPELSLRFIQFVLSQEGQKLWAYRLGTPGGPERYSLQRLPIRRDFYVAENLQYASNPDLNPFEQAASFTYHIEWTGKLFSGIRLLVRTMAIDTGQELREAWSAILAAGGPSACPEAMEAFLALPEDAEYARIGTILAGLKTKVDEIRLARVWGQFFAEHYRAARDLALKGQGNPS
jgi:ABC-type Fe3+ transport system substrate-binding protein